jgi:phytoene dehydrogenase-like protein
MVILCFFLSNQATIALAIEAQEHGVEIRENTEVFDIKPFQTINSKVAMPVTNGKLIS